MNINSLMLQMTRDEASYKKTKKNKTIVAFYYSIIKPNLQNITDKRTEKKHLPSRYIPVYFVHWITLCNKYKHVDFWTQNITNWNPMYFKQKYTNNKYILTLNYFKYIVRVYLWFAVPIYRIYEWVYYNNLQDSL